MDAGFVEAREKVVTFSHSNIEYVADLTDDGHIYFQSMLTFYAKWKDAHCVCKQTKNLLQLKPLRTIYIK